MWRAKEQERQRHMWSMKWQSPVPGKPACAGGKGDNGAGEGGGRGTGSFCVALLKFTVGKCWWPIFFF